MSDKVSHYREYMPKQAKDICDVIGILPTIALVKQYGGQSIYVASRSDAPSCIKLAECIGEEAVNLLSRYVAGGYLSIPICTKVLRAKRNDELRTEFDRLTMLEKMSSREAVKTLIRFFEQPIHERQIWRILKSTNG
ncbi:Mor transcription activator family protein [Undibacterium flavidum]|uniref:Mor transcription activator domain-containing protein n=1 Tax=Undibacterium flavidum TaxID=2762297 RepID=A0ABR6Y737_9BURK|nr:Mor transcription activator family protein [Undibacterium flavidum]MBC3872408.1 hypothetical protein [Undibacterium flavidum]